MCVECPGTHCEPLASVCAWRTKERQWGPGGRAGVMDASAHPGFSSNKHQGLLCIPLIDLSRSL